MVVGRARGVEQPEAAARGAGSQVRSQRAAPLLRSIRSRHMFAQLCVYGSVLAQTYATITGMTSFPTFQIRYLQQNGAVVAVGYNEGDCMCLDYCVSSIVLFVLFDIALEVLYVCATVTLWVATSTKATIPCHLSTSSLPLRCMLLVTLLGIHPIACLMMVALLIIAMKALRFACVVIYRPAVHLPHPAVERLLQVRVASPPRRCSASHPAAERSSARFCDGGSGADICQVWQPLCALIADFTRRHAAIIVANDTDAIIAVAIIPSFALEDSFSTLSIPLTLKPAKISSRARSQLTPRMISFK